MLRFDVPVRHTGTYICACVCVCVNINNMCVLFSINNLLSICVCDYVRSTVALRAIPNSKFDRGVSMHNRHTQRLVFTLNITDAPESFGGKAKGIEFPSEAHQKQINDLFPSYLQSTMLADASGSMDVVLTERESDDVALINGNPFRCVCVSLNTVWLSNCLIL
jgi:hypothetical protein